MTKAKLPPKMTSMQARVKLDRIRNDTVKRHQTHVALLTLQQQIRNSQDSATKEMEYNRLLGAQTLAHTNLPQHARHRMIQLKNILNK